jgi:mRNA-degrading endonuclease RelE of RelBE toxin-antitoxin system
MTRVLLTRQAKRHFDELSLRLREPVLNTLTELAADPQRARKPLLGPVKGLWSARTGSYRIVYSIGGSSRSPKVIVRGIRHRATAYESGRKRG